MFEEKKKETQALPLVHRVDLDDSVAVALSPLPKGTELVVGSIRVTVQEPIEPYHKVALRDHALGQLVTRFGAPIGRAIQPIFAGTHVHVHNVETCLSGPKTYSFQPNQPRPQLGSEHVKETFMGYLRQDGRVATRNEIWVVPTVGCVANICEQIALKCRTKFAERIDTVRAMTHPLGCSQLGDDLGSTRRVLASLACHPNAGGVVFVALGCESNQIDALLPETQGLLPERVRVIRAQVEEHEIDAGVRAVEELVEVMDGDHREPRPVSDLVIGLKCGGSDALSGLTANPLLGTITNRVASAGGTVLLTEIPEIFGAEHLLLQRAANREAFDALVNLVNGFKEYFIEHKQPVHENPSPGNIAGGITTLEEKSLGAVQKAGTAPVMDVIGYGQRVRKSGLTLLEAPGNDAVSGTALTAAGATLVLFTTGRGTPLGFPAPTVKIASNSSLAQRKRAWIDYDAGGVLSDGMGTVADDFMAKLLALASGQPTCSEVNGEGSIAIWKRGVTL
ncbi:MAG: altronate dehydratase family protein [Myxococcales bacterium]|nr:altronate dehydratase family protein [Myxococcales bacterium]